MQESLIQNEVPSHAFTFKGDGGRYFLICLVNSLLVIITLGIYLPWALMKCRRYIYSNMYLNGQSFNYQVTGGDVFCSWLMLLVIYLAGMLLLVSDYIAVGAVILLLLVLSVPALIVKNLQFQAIKTSLNGVRFGFHCSAMRALWNILALPALLLMALAAVAYVLLEFCPAGSASEIIISSIVLGVAALAGMGAIVGVIYSRLMTLVGEGGSFGIHRFAVQVNARYCIKSALLAMAALIPFLLVAGYILSSLIVSIVTLDTAGMLDEELQALIIYEYQRQIIICQIIYYLGIAVMMSYLIVALRNHFLNNLQLADGHIRFRSTLTFHGMAYRLCGLYVISAITGGLAYPLLRVWVLAWLAKNTYVVGDLDALELTDSDEIVDNGLLSRLSRGVMPTLNFM